jgi:hypothetical protein
MLLRRAVGYESFLSDVYVFVDHTLLHGENGRVKQQAASFSLSTLLVSTAIRQAAKRNEEHIPQSNLHSTVSSILAALPKQIVMRTVILSTCSMATSTNPFVSK